MVYVSEGRVLQNRPWGLGRIVDLFWGAVEFVTLFFKTLVGLDNRQPIGAGTSRGSGGGPGNGPPRGPRRFGGITTIEDCSMPGGG